MYWKRNKKRKRNKRVFLLLVPINTSYISIYTGRNVHIQIRTHAYTHMWDNSIFHDGSNHIWQKQMHVLRHTVIPGATGSLKLDEKGEGAGFFCNCLCKGLCPARVCNEYVRNLLCAFLLQTLPGHSLQRAACAEERTDSSRLVLSRHLPKFSLKSGKFLSWISGLWQPVDFCDYFQ